VWYRLIVIVVRCTAKLPEQLFICLFAFVVASCGRIHFEPLEVESQQRIGLGYAYTCFLRPSGSVMCWGAGLRGHLGYGNTNDIGDDETPASIGDVPLGASLVSFDTGADHTCGRTVGDGVRCWGQGASGRLGYVNVDDIGDDEPASARGDVDVGGAVVKVATAGEHSCALLESGAVRCWGSGAGGRLGYGVVVNIGDDELPSTAGDVPLGGTAVDIDARGSHTCARLDSGGVRCWGDAANGQLGYSNPNNIGDNEPAGAGGDVDIGGTVVELSVGANHTCARLDSGAIRCWGNGADGRLGYGNVTTIGDDELPSSAGDVPMGGRAVGIAAGANHTCALLDTGAVRCWGLGASGQLGYGNSQSIGDDETPASAGDVPLGGRAVDIEAGGDHTCALLTTGRIRCWGAGTNGQLGYANTLNVGDDETPASVGDVPID